MSEEVKNGWRCWVGKGDHDYPWRVAALDGSLLVFAGHVDFYVPVWTEESARAGSHPPPYTIRSVGRLRIKQYSAGPNVEGFLKTYKTDKLEVV